jgi:hypothetical protein
MIFLFTASYAVVRSLVRVNDAVRVLELVGQGLPKSVLPGVEVG